MTLSRTIAALAALTFLAAPSLPAGHAGSARAAESAQDAATTALARAGLVEVTRLDPSIPPAKVRPWPLPTSPIVCNAW